MRKIVLGLISLLILAACNPTQKKEGHQAKTATDSNGFSYEYVENDPMNLRIYTLENGLKVYLSKNDVEPRAVGLVSVNVGAKDDPRDNTGLAHYLEHLLFKGTSEFGTLNWEEEQKYLQQIEDLFEVRKTVTDEAERKALYQQIDSLSQIAASFAAPNEYDKLMSVLGAKGTNAWTSADMTTYINNIPSNEIERWIKVEADRFGDLVLRLFHTELEAVYEEFNMYQSSASSVVNNVIIQEFYKNHPYGVEVIGKADHLKNPSMKSIKEFFNKYYVPNNMAIVLSGELDYEKTIATIDKYWGKFEPSEEIVRSTYEKEAPLAGPVEKEVFTQEAEYVELAFRTAGVGTKDELCFELIDYILSNSKAGLIDLNLIQQQKVLRAYSYHQASDDYGKFVLHGNPREGQTLQEVKDLLLEQLDKVKKGEFDEWLLQAIIDNQQVSRIHEWESNMRAYTFAFNFHQNTSHSDYLNHFEALSKITKQELVDFANKHLNENYVLVYKRFGENKDLVRMDKPAITPIDIDRSQESEYYKNFKAEEVKDIEPVFVDFNEAIDVEMLNEGTEFDYIQNAANDLFSLTYVIKAGSNADKKLQTAVSYLPYVGTSTMSADSLQKLMFKLAIDISVGTGSDQSAIYFSGLNKNFKEGLEIFKQVLTDAVGEQEPSNMFVDGILKKRSDNKQNKRFIFWGGLSQYATYGKDNPINNSLTAEEMKGFDAATIMEKVHQLRQMPKNVMYYGPMGKAEVIANLNELNLMPSDLLPLPEAKNFEQIVPTENRVLFVNYDIVQSDVAFMYLDEKYNDELSIPAAMFNEYYGGNMSSIIFQEIRESKGLAYSAYSYYNVPNDTTKYHNIMAYLGTQPDKIDIASKTMLNLMNEMPYVEANFNDSKNALQKRMKSERYKADDIFYTYLSAQKVGKDNDGRKEMYDAIANYSIADVKSFFDGHIKGKPYTMIVIGSKEYVDFDVLKKYGKVQELSLEELFHNY